MLKMSILSLLLNHSAYISLNYLENFLPYDNNESNDDTKWKMNVYFLVCFFFWGVYKPISRPHGIVGTLPNIESDGLDVSQLHSLREVTSSF